MWPITCDSRDKPLKFNNQSFFLIAGKIQISNSTNMILDMQGGFKTEERGGVEVKGKGLMQTFWLIEEKGKELPPSKWVVPRGAESAVQF